MYGYPLTLWFTDMYGRDRLQTINNLNGYAYDYIIDDWFCDMQFIVTIANKLKNAMLTTITKHLLPPLRVQNITEIICDDLNEFFQIFCRNTALYY